MRSLFLVLLLANLLVFAAQFNAIRDLVRTTKAVPNVQLNAERLRIIRDTSNRSGDTSDPMSRPAAPA
jgi:hypothetical protein